MNGVKMPNHVSEDIGFVTTFWPGLKAVAAAPGIIPYNEAYAIYEEDNKTNSEAQLVCSRHGTNKSPYTLANLYELASAISINRDLSSMPYAQNWWSASLVPSGSGNIFYVWDGGQTNYDSPTRSYHAYCVRR